jgi:hypothetical protein
LRLEQATIAEWQGASEDQKYVAKPTQPKIDSSSCFGINHKFQIFTPPKFLRLNDQSWGLYFIQYYPQL